MHIHAGHLNPGLQSNRSGDSEAAMAARRAEAARKRLLGVASSLDALSGSDNAWTIQMAQAWAGGNGAGHQETFAQDNSGDAEPGPAPSDAPAKIQPVTRSAPSKLVSFWA